MKRSSLIVLALPIVIAGCTAIAGIAGYDEVPCAPCSDATAADGLVDGREDTQATESSGEVVDTAPGDAVDSGPRDSAVIDTGPTPDVIPFDAACSEAATDSGGCPCGMVQLPGGTYLSHTGSNKTVVPFCMDTTEVTESAFRAWCEGPGASVCTPSDFSSCGSTSNYGVAGRENDPINCVVYQEAVSYCLAVGKVLPDEFEWEFAERGAPSSGGGTNFPWPSGGLAAGDTTHLCWTRLDDAGTCKVRTYEAGKSPQGVYDLAGNVEEWTTTPGTLGGGPSFVRRGGSYFSTEPDNVSAAAGRGELLATDREKLRGFRCIKR